VPAGVSLVPPILVFLLTIVAFLPTLQNGFVNGMTSHSWSAILITDVEAGRKFTGCSLPSIEFLHARDRGDLWVGLCFAVESFRLALQIRPGLPEIHEQLARALAQQGK
jgi:hypothetical protein